MGEVTEENLQIEFDVVSTVGWQGKQLSKYEIQKLKEKLKHQLKDLIYDNVLEFDDVCGDSGLYDFTVSFDIKHL